MAYTLSILANEFRALYLSCAAKKWMYPFTDHHDAVQGRDDPGRS